jgi:hypothetical protein
MEMDTFLVGPKEVKLTEAFDYLSCLYTDHFTFWAQYSLFLSLSLYLFLPPSHMYRDNLILAHVFSHIIAYTPKIFNFCELAALNI